MRNFNPKPIKGLHFSDNAILKNATLKNLKGGTQRLEQAVFVDNIKCENAFRKAERINGDGLW